MKNIVTDNFFDRVLDILKNARKQAKKALNISMAPFPAILPCSDCSSK